MIPKAVSRDATFFLGSGLKARVLTALLLVPLIVACALFLPAILFMFVTAALLLWAVWEWSRLMGLERIRQRFKYLLIVAVVFVVAGFLAAHWVLWAALCWWLFSLYWVWRYPNATGMWAQGPIVRGVMGLFVLIPTWVALNVLHAFNHGHALLLFFLLLIWSVDTGAYFIGRRYGRRKLAPALSPGKTLEGLLGGIAAALIVALIGAFILGIPLGSIPILLLLTLVMGLFSVQGDLLESMLKRAVGLKDSGQILPGHGGFLDRIDSLTAAAPVFVLGLLLLGL